MSFNDFQEFAWLSFGGVVQVSLLVLVITAMVVSVVSMIYRAFCKVFFT